MPINETKKPSIDSIKVKAFQEKIFSWWKKNKRELPWRETENPYFILVSEVMLQQTQVNRTVEKYLAFIKKFPTVESLAKAETAEVLKLWAGLGYNRRALWLQEAAKVLATKKEFPKTAEELRKLKGIGPYTSRSILIFAFNADIATVDTNIRRILIHEGFAEEDTKEKELLKIATILLPKKRSRDWHNALMDYGSLVLTAAKTGIKPTTTQPKFKQSTRAYRGCVVRLLTQKAAMSKKELIKECKIPQILVQKVFASLIKDKLIKKKKDEMYSLP